MDVIDVSVASMSDKKFDVFARYWYDNNDESTMEDYPYVCVVGQTPRYDDTNKLPVYKTDIQNGIPKDVINKVFKTFEDEGLIGNKYYILRISKTAESQYHATLVTDTNPLVCDFDNVSNKLKVRTFETSNVWDADFVEDYPPMILGSVISPGPHNDGGSGNTVTFSYGLEFVNPLIDSNEDVVVIVNPNQKDIFDGDDKIVFENRDVPTTSDNAMPLWQLNGVGMLPTSTERESINMVTEAYFDSTGIKLYATDQPTEDLTLEMKV